MNTTKIKQPKNLPLHCPAVDLRMAVNHLDNLPVTYRLKKTVTRQQLVRDLKDPKPGTLKEVINGRDKSLLAALNHYGFTSKKSDNQLELTEPALQIICRPRNEEVDRDTIKHILRRVTGFMRIAELYHKGNSLTVERSLIAIHGLDPIKAKRTVNCYAKSVDFAGLNATNAYNQVFRLLTGPKGTTSLSADNRNKSSSARPTPSINGIDSGLLEETIIAAIAKYEEKIDQLKKALFSLRSES